MPINRTAITLGDASTPVSVDWENEIKNGLNDLKSNAADLVDLEPVGTIRAYIGSTLPSTGKYLFCDGGTIGNGSSGGTARANADTQTLFELLWNSMGNSEAPVSSGRGASAAADFAANKTIQLPDLRGRVLIGVDGSAGRITSASTGGGNADTLGGTGGSQTHTLTTSELASHDHGHGAAIQTNASGGSGTYGGLGNGSSRTQSTGGGSAHSNTQPWIAVNYLIKY